MYEITYDISRLYTAMLEQGWTVLELARHCNRNEATVRQLFKRGSGRPGTVRDIAGVLGLRLKDIIIQPNGKSRKRRTA